MLKKGILMLALLTAIFSYAAFAQTCDNPCIDNIDCAEGEQCADGCCAAVPPPCEMPCFDMSECLLGQDCNSGCCGPAPCELPCSTNDDCEIDHTCVAGCCDTIPCVSDSDCPFACPAPENVFVPQACNMCEGGLCVDPPCTNDNQCKESPDNVCTTNTCTVATGICVTTFNSLPCNDGNPCTIGDTCGSGSCQTGSPKNCADLFACTTDSCNTNNGNCINAPSDAACDDGVACTDDNCDQNNGCENTPQNNQCDDGLQCTSDVCDGSGCIFSCTDDDGDGICT